MGCKKIFFIAISKGLKSLGTSILPVVDSVVS